MNVNNLGENRHHPELAHILGIAHFGIGQNGKVVELDTIVLTKSDQLINTIAEGVVGLAWQSQNQVAVGFDLICRETSREAQNMSPGRYYLA